MWTLESISAKNIISFQELEYDIHQKVTTLVYGNNMDNDSQASNGSGKSTLLEAISIAITGEPLRKVKVDEVINDAADSACVSIRLSNSFFKESLVVAREFSRKSPQTVSCVILNESGEQIKQEETTHASVSGYNQYILDKIGLTKEEIYDNFILSKHRFTPFLSASDKDKKEIINKFSNAIIVDDAIVAVNEDIDLFDQKCQKFTTEIAKLDGAIAAGEEQIQILKDDALEKASVRKETMSRLREQIKQHQDNIAAYRKLIREHNDKLGELDNIYNQLADIEQDTSLSFKNAYQAVLSLFKDKKISGLSDWSVTIQTLSEDLKTAQKQADVLSNERESLMLTIEQKQTKLDGFREKLKSLQTVNDKHKCELQTDISKCNDVLSQLEAKLSVKEDVLRKTKRAIANLEGALEGVIICPKCAYEFMLHSQIDIPATRAEIAKLSKEQGEIANNIIELDKKHQNATSELRSLKKSLESVDDNLLELNKEIGALTNEINREYNRATEMQRNQHKLETQINDCSAKISNASKNMYDEAFDIIDSLTRTTESERDNYQVKLQTSTGSIEVCQSSLEELANEQSSHAAIDKLVKNIEEYKSTRELQQKEFDKVAVKWNNLKFQLEHFIKFKTYLANGKISALGQVTNSFLQEIGSDLRIKFDGYTVLKSGKVRDKISISLIRAGVDCGSFDKLSEGEKARVNLASILAMNKLINSNCEDGKGLDLLILDEILEASDETGLANIFSALNDLQITSLIVSHGNVAENYPYKLIVNKKNGISYINE